MLYSIHVNFETYFAYIESIWNMGQNYSMNNESLHLPKLTNQSKWNPVKYIPYKEWNKTGFPPLIPPVYPLIGAFSENCKEI